MNRYIVCDKIGPLVIGHYDDTPKAGVLLHGEGVSLMPYTTARRAMDRTKRYAKEHGLVWSFGVERIFRAAIAQLENEKD